MKGLFVVVSFFHATTRRSCSGKGSGRSNTAYTTLKIAVFAPMPNASVTTAIKLKPGFFNNIRAPMRRSCQSVRIIGFRFQVSGFRFQKRDDATDFILTPDTYSRRIAGLARVFASFLLLTSVSDFQSFGDLLVKRIESEFPA